MRMLALLAVAFGATGCIGGTNSEQLIAREAVASAFDAAGEPVRLELDMATADPGSPIDSLYSAKDEYETTAGPFEVVLLEDEDSASAHAARLEARWGSGVDVLRERNVVLVVLSTVGNARRMRLVEVLESL
jgi:hypothetical protein